MIFDKNFFKWLAFIIKLIQLFIGIFGEPNEKTEAKKNHIDI